jgi:hypothetical protein
VGKLRLARILSPRHRLRGVLKDGFSQATEEKSSVPHREDPMDELREIRPVSPELLSLVPQTLAEAETLAASIERAVQQETAGGVANLSVIVRDDRVWLHGSCSSYYCKQLAQHAAMSVPSSLNLTNCIEVD